MQRLNLWGSSIGDIGTSKLFHAIIREKNNLTSLDLSRSNIQLDGATVISQALESINCSLTYLNLNENPIQSAGLKSIFHSVLQNACLKTLSISRIGLDYVGVEIITQFIQNNQKTLTTLLMNGNYIGNKGVERISEALKVNTTLTELGLSSNKITEEGGIYIKEAVRLNKTLNTLWLIGNKLSKECKTGINEAWKTESRLNGCIFKYVV